MKTKIHMMYEEMTGNSRQGRYINAEKKYVATKKYEKQEIIYIYMKAIKMPQEKSSWPDL